MRRDPKRSDGKKTLKNLIGSANELFAAYGYYGVSVPMIARKASVKNATFYQYFNDKESIYQKLLEHSFGKFQSYMQKVNGTKLDQVVRSFVESYFEFFSNNQHCYKILHEAVYLRKFVFRKVEKTLNRILDKIAPKYDEEKKMVLRWFVTGPVRFISIYKSLHNDYSVDQKVVDDLVEFAMKGLDPNNHELSKDVFEIDVQPLKIEVTSTRMKLLQAAEKLFGTHGYRNTMISDITRIAGVASGTFYVHFDSKEKALEELVMSTNKNMRITIATAIKRFSDRRDAEIAGFLAFLKFFMLHSNMYLIVRQAEFFNPDISRIYYEKIFNSYLPPLKKAMKDGQFNAFSPENLALALMGIGHFMGEDLVVQKYGNIQNVNNYLSHLSLLIFKGIPTVLTDSD
ncbi:TetR/AcrR family transcriptional regulator [Thermotoga profunda]|uniref:TetR/AcrR family transcriptional regulator n=1 Tax=Thermotoga profunda TaxID=1508420 RepID=UPI0005977EED|nr:TetR/AcrR family transcriptional regulator [Thermotoga profunda]